MDTGHAHKRRVNDSTYVFIYSDIKYLVKEDFG